MGALSPSNWALWRLPRPALAYVLSLHATAAGVLLGLLFSPAAWEASTGELLFAGLCFLAVTTAFLAERRLGAAASGAIHSTQMQHDGWLLAAALICPPWLALLAVFSAFLTDVLLATLKLLPSTPGRAYLPHRELFNVSNASITTVAAAGVWSLVGGPEAWMDMASLSPLLGLSGAFLTVLLLLPFLTMCVIFLTSKGSFLFLLRGHLLDVKRSIPSLSLGVLAAATWTVAPLLALLVFPLFFGIQKGLLYRGLLEQSRTDSKTGLASADFWYQSAERHVRRALTDGSPLSLLVVDLDHFKAVNDTLGHLAGDAVLREVAQRLRASVRPGDLVGRFGGEEFTVLLPDAASQEAFLVAERVRASLAADSFLGPRMLRVTCSVGVASVSGGEDTSLEDVLDQADAAMYAAKDSGRNQVSSAGAPAESLRRRRRRVGTPVQ